MAWLTFDCGKHLVERAGKKRGTPLPTQVVTRC
jgi:hypothetical protein